MHAMRAGDAIRRSDDDGRAPVIRLIGFGTVTDVALARFPGALEIGAIALWIVAVEEFLVARDARRDEILRDFVEHRPALFVIRRQQCIPAPALQPCRKLPTEIDGVFETIVETKAPIGRVAVRSIARDKDSGSLIAL